MDGREVYAIEVIDIGNNGYDMEMIVKELVLWRWKDGGNVCVCTQCKVQGVPAGGIFLSVRAGVCVTLCPSSDCE